MGGRERTGWSGVKGGKWDNCNSISIIVKQVAGETVKVILLMIYLESLFIIGFSVSACVMRK